MHDSDIAPETAASIPGETPVPEEPTAQAVPEPAPEVEAAALEAAGNAHAVAESPASSAVEQWIASLAQPAAPVEPGASAEERWVLSMIARSAAPVAAIVQPPPETVVEQPVPAVVEQPAETVVEQPVPAVAESAAEASIAAEQPQPATPGVQQQARKPKPPVDPAVLEERRRRAQEAWDRVVAARESSEVLTGTVTAAVKGGLLVDVGGIRGFLPASQVRPPQGSAIDTLVKQKLPMKVIDIDAGRRRIVVSHRRALEEERRTKRAELLSSLAIGQIREAVVVRLADFGAFVDLGGIDGLIPMSELAFERVEKAGDVVKIGEHLQVSVLRIDEGGKKIALSRKNALPDPWRDHANVLRQGTTVEGTIVAKEPRLQVEIAPGVIGTVRESDANPADYEIGEAIEVAVRSVDRRTRRIVLTTMHGAAAMPTTSSTSSGFAPLGVELGRRT
ncbi:MAG: S1 RNA-binding domain-containing protein [Candidatus Eremiobacteraeota bacterium]|nr:S1 RNA-binding domain-containing protein [Candidatus Eremiobacteraeota bacterium]